MNIETQDTSDYSDYGHQDIVFMVDGLEIGCDPYINDELKDFLNEFIDVDNTNNFDKIFKNVFLCLARIIESIDLWDKELGKDGYYKFIGQTMFDRGFTVNADGFIFNDKILQKNLIDYK